MQKLKNNPVWNKIGKTSERDKIAAEILDFMFSKKYHQITYSPERFYPMDLLNLYIDLITKDRNLKDRFLQKLYHQKLKIWNLEEAFKQTLSMSPNLAKTLQIKLFDKIQKIVVQQNKTKSVGSDYEDYNGLVNKYIPLKYPEIKKEDIIQIKLVLMRLAARIGSNYAETIAKEIDDLMQNKP